MTWLGGWLRELILVVLLAAFVEMLLPSKSMERYARLVLSLLVLLTMLSPIVSFLKGDAAAELSVAMVQQEKHGGLLSGAGDGADSLEKILADGRMLAAGAKEQSLKLAAEEVAGQMRDQIAGSTGVSGAKVTVTLGMGKAPGEGGGEDVPLITSVNVSLPAVAGAVEAGGTGSESDNGTGTAEPVIIQPVEPVQVSLGGDQGETAEAGTEAETGTGTSVEDSSRANTDEEMIIKLLEQNWSLERETIHIQGGNNDAEKL